MMMRISRRYELLLIPFCWFCPRRFVMVLLGVAVLGSIWIVWRHRPIPEQLGARRDGLKQSVIPGLTAWLIALGIVIAVHLFQGNFIRPMWIDRPLLLVIITVFYPLSALAQEFLFRSFMFWRYEPVLPPKWIIPISALSFGWVHIIYGSWVSVLLATAGGAVLSTIYARYRNLWGVWIVHALFGISVFALGHGQYFYHGQWR